MDYYTWPPRHLTYLQPEAVKTIDLEKRNSKGTFYSKIKLSVLLSEHVPKFEADGSYIKSM